MNWPLLSALLVSALTVTAPSAFGGMPTGVSLSKEALEFRGIKPGSTLKHKADIDLDAVQQAAGSEFFGQKAVKSLQNVQAERPLRGAKEAQLYKQHSRSVVLIATPDGLGSGSLIDQEGRILTNWHVVRGYSAVAVVFKPVLEGQEPSTADMRRGTVVRVDEVADLALVQVPSVPAGVEPLTLGEMDAAVVGADVHAIGHPTGEAWTYTRGTISQVRQQYQWTAQDRRQHRADVIQTQTPINPGNSGGPLLSDDGALIGVNSFKAQREGLNFAVGVDEVRRFLSAASGDRLAESITPPSRTTAVPGCEAAILYQGTSPDNTAAVAGIDVDCDRRADGEWVAPYDIRKPAYLAIDTNKDGFIDKMIFSADRTMRWNYSLHDTDFDRQWDLACQHEDGGIKPTRCEPYKVSSRR